MPLSSSIVAIIVVNASIWKDGVAVPRATVVELRTGVWTGAAVVSGMEEGVASDPEWDWGVAAMDGTLLTLALAFALLSLTLLLLTALLLLPAVEPSSFLRSPPCQWPRRRLEGRVAASASGDFLSRLAVWRSSLLSSRIRRSLSLSRRGYRWIPANSHSPRTYHQIVGIIR